jgi:glycosyltransferase involved in cell wall biosynthesis
MLPFRERGLQIVRYSPAEYRYFNRVGSFAGEDALIRFGKYPDDYGPWVGDLPVVGNVTQHMKQRGDACGYAFWEAATAGLPVRPAGPGSEEIGGLGSLSYEAMLEYLRHIRVYLYTGTTPASYTLGLIEAMLSGVPVVSIGPKAWGERFDGADLFEADTIVGRVDFNDPTSAGALMNQLLKQEEWAALYSVKQRALAIDLFGIETVGTQWREFLS